MVRYLTRSTYPKRVILFLALHLLTCLLYAMPTITIPIVPSVPDVTIYEINYKNDDGTWLYAEAVLKGSVPSYNGPSPSKPATAEYTYTFAGWNPAVTAAYSNQTYTATYNAVKNKYEVVFKNDDGTIFQRSVVTYGDVPSYTGDTPTRSATDEFTYEFEGWTPSITSVTGAQTYTAKFKAITKQYKVVFQNYDGAILQQSNVAYGDVPSYTGVTPVRPATGDFTYEFDGWNPTITVVKGVQIYTAKFKVITRKYEVIFQNEDGTELQRTNVAYGETPKYNGSTPTKPSTAEFTYTFAGWSPSITSVTGSATYEATFTSVKKQYAIIFQNEDGTELQRSNVAYGETPKYNGSTPTKPSTAEFTYTFAGWTPSITLVTGTATYKATFTSVKKQYEIIFQNEDGTELQRTNVAYGETPVYNGEPPVKEATDEFTYTFNGWSPSIGSVTESQTYTATYISTPIENKEACKNAQSINKYDWLLMLDVNELNKQGYSFTEQDVTWYKIIDGGDDQQVGSGFSYTVDQSLMGTGSYYALINLPKQTKNVGCKGVYSTKVYEFSGSSQQKVMLVPSIVAPKTTVSVINLPKEDVTISVYDQSGKLFCIIKSNGEDKVEFISQELSGNYFVEVQSLSEKTTLRYIVQ